MRNDKGVWHIVGHFIARRCAYATNQIAQSNVDFAAKMRRFSWIAQLRIPIQADAPQKNSRNYMTLRPNTIVYI